MGDSLSTLDCTGKSTRQINQFIKGVAQHGSDGAVILMNADCRHNLVVGITSPLIVQIPGHVGYYCCGLCDGVDASIDGDAGWGLAENLMSGRVALSGSAGAAAGATMRGGKLFIGRNAGSRCGISMKGGVLIVGGDVGYMTGFMMQKGVLVIGGNAGEGLGDSLYEGIIYIRGQERSLGTDAVYSAMNESDFLLLAALIDDAGIDAAAADFRKIVSGKRLYNFSTKESEIWRSAL